VGKLLFLCLAAFPALAEAADLTSVLQKVENRYNGAKTLEVQFSETYVHGRTRRTESGTLLLQKPGRMRWYYKSPEGKLFLSDGKFIYLYTPGSNRVERMKAKESEDMRAPLAFLLGKLDFSRDFGRFTWRQQGDEFLIHADPKSANLPYTAVEFIVSPDYRIRRVQVTGHDRSVLDFHFSNEKRNPPVNASVFRFQMPAGAELVEVGE
jgi:outer membrane lipoprotein carrier protein